MHFLNGTEWSEKPHKALWYLLDACRHFGWLTPQYLTEGFEDHQLKAILDLQIDNYRLPYRTHFLADLAEAVSGGDYRDLIDKVVSAGGSVITQNQSGGHWLLVTTDKREAVVIDSGNYEHPRSVLNDRRLADDGWGVAILPHERPLVEVAL
jgi:hypothetical protein